MLWPWQTNDAKLIWNADRLILIGQKNIFFVERYGKLQCLICLATVAVFKEANIKRHWETNHTKTTKYATMASAARLAYAATLEDNIKRQETSFSKKSTLQLSNEAIT